MIKRLIAPSLLSADFTCLGAEVEKMEKADADWLHYDVMDAHFVPTLSFGPSILKQIRPLTRLPLDVHVMAEDPERLIDDLVDAGADGITFHIETVKDAPALARHLARRGVKVGVTLNPATPLASLEEVLSLVDMVLVMTVVPGFGGQKLIPQCLEKIRSLRQRFPALDIQADGGINPETIASVYEAGANIIVAGSAVFHAPDAKKMIETLRNA